MSSIEPEPENLINLPIERRPDRSKSKWRLISFNSSFFISLIILHSTQLIFSPLIIIRGSFFSIINTFAKEVFAIVLVFITQVFGPTRFVITAEDGIDLRQMVETDRKGRIVSINLPHRSITMANHQIYADWLYIWCLAYLGQIHGSIIIILKASLKWVPIVGPAMQMFSFIFLNRSWTTDKDSLTQNLIDLGRGTNHGSLDRFMNRKLTLLIFPEGTLVSPLTRPISTRYAQKSGYPDLRHCLLPRSTGILFCIRALSKTIPDLQLVDLTIGYPGIPASGNGQDYYTLQSIFGYGQSPPTVHVHLRIIPISSIPIGDSHLLAGSQATTSKMTEMIDPTIEESTNFDRWLVDQWSKKDQILETFYRTGQMIDPQPEDDRKSGAEDWIGERKVEVKVRLRSGRDPWIVLSLYVPGMLLIWCSCILISHCYEVIGSKDWKRVWGV